MVIFEQASNFVIVPRFIRGQDAHPGPKSLKYTRSLWLSLILLVLLIIGLKKRCCNKWMKSAALLAKVIGIINTSLVVKHRMTWLSWNSSVAAISKTSLACLFFFPHTRAAKRQTPVDCSASCPSAGGAVSAFTPRWQQGRHSFALLLEIH